jgi:hypothetical protein
MNHYDQYQGLRIEKEINASGTKLEHDAPFNRGFQPQVWRSWGMTLHLPLMLELPL